ncbi:MAG: OmpH family outer membrane protein [Parafilimonas sp.]|nr:OmpH family outer membrane protein [Parafilimonas sp.]
MNKLLLGLNIVLLIALGYLYYAFYDHKDAKPVNVSQQPASKTGFKIAYFDLDTLEKYYTFAKETRDYLKGKNDAMESKLNNIRQQYTAKVNDYNKRGSTLSQTEQSQMQEDLARLDNYYSQQQQSLGQDFQGEYMQKMLELKTKIQDFLKQYSVQKGYEYVFATSSDDNVIYYKDSVRNITNDIVGKLNDIYKNEKKK